MIPLIRHCRRKASHIAFNNIFYNWTLGGGDSEPMVLIPPDTWPGNADRGRHFCDVAVPIDSAQRGECWDADGADPLWLADMHSFGWMRDLRALGGDAARRQARVMIESWMEHHARWSAFAWRPDITGERVAHWIAMYDFYSASVDEDFELDMRESLTRQARHLSRALPGDVHGIALLRAARGLAYAGLAFSGREAWLEQALDILQTETDKQILPDGGHVSRSPQTTLDALRVFIDIRAGLAAAGYPVPEQIEHTIDRVAQAVRFFRYADKGLAVFNGAQEGDAYLIDTALFKSNARGRALRALPHMGYERATLGRSVLMMDSGAPPAWPYDGDAHAAPLAFEFSYGKERIFTSCGSHPLDSAWHDALRATAAHNSAVIDCRNACELRDDGHFGRRPRAVRVEREETNDSVLLEGSHDGYVPVNGVTHRRRLFLSDQGHDLRGEDSFNCAVGLNKPAEIAVRFHIHPKVQISIIREGEEALLRLSGGSGWRFFHSGGALTLENSLYLGEDGRPRKTKQLVIHGLMESDNARIKWALQREGR